MLLTPSNLAHKRVVNPSVRVYGPQRRRFAICNPSGEDARSNFYKLGNVRIAAVSGAIPSDDGNIFTKAKSRVASMFTVFSDEKCNRQFLALAIGQMLCSIATLIHDSYLPVYVQDELGLTNTKIGAIQGLAQFLCQISKGVSGVIGDVLGSQVRVLVFGTFMTFLCKPMFVMLSSVYGIFGVTACLYWFFFAKMMDRMSKGVREAPTKAVMNELSRESGDAPDAAYGLRQSLATAGALIGSTVASAVFCLTGQNYVLTFSCAMVPPAIALVWLMVNFREELFGTKPVAAVTSTPPPTAPTPDSLQSASVSVPETDAQPGSGAADAAPEPKLSLLQKGRVLVAAFKPVYWQALAVVAVLYFARFDASFLSLRAKQVMSVSFIPMLFLICSLMQALLTAPLSRLSGSSVHSRNSLLFAGFGVMIAANTVFSLPLFANQAGMLLGAALLGLHMAMTHSITVSMVASYMPTGEVKGLGKLSGTAVSFTDVLLGFILAASNGVAGVLSDQTKQAGLGNVGCFFGGATACSLAIVLLFIFSKFGDLGKDELVMKKKKKKAA